MIKRSNARFKVISCGRRFGKTLLGACLCWEKALKGGVVWWVAPDYPRAKIGWRMMMKIAKQIPGVITNKAELTIEVPGGGFIQVKSAKDPDSLRGEGLDLVVIDECADVPEDAWTDALSPALTDKLGDAVFIGTPKGRNWFYRLWLMAKATDQWAAFRMPTHTNPFINRNELIRLEGVTPDRTWRQEYLAEFVTFSGRVYESFDPSGNMVFCEEPDMSKYETFFGSIDFGFRNPTAIVIAGETKDGAIDVIDEFYGSRLKPDQLIEVVEKLQEKYDIRQWWGDAADPRMIEMLADEGFPIDPSPRSTGSQETFVQYEIRLVSGLLEEEPVALRFYEANCPESIREHDSYRYPKVRHESVERETPLKVDDHTCNAVQYLVHGISDYYGVEEKAMMDGTYDSLNIPY